VNTAMSVLLAAPAPLPLHSLPTWVDICAMAVAAAFGAATGRNRRLPLLAVLIAGVISGLAGGMIRDVLLGLEAAAIKNWYYIPAVLLAALAGGFLAHRLIQGHVPYLLARAWRWDCSSPSGYKRASNTRRQLMRPYSSEF
jgi:uncharacterized membrane protein YeiH